MVGFDLTALGVSASAIGVFLWAQRHKILGFVSQVLDLQMAKSLERNSDILTKVYELMNEILVTTDESVSNVAIVKYHNGMDKLTIHSNIHKTMIHELCNQPEGNLKDSIQDIIVDSKTMESLLELIPKSDKEEGKMTLVDSENSGFCQRIYSGAGIQRYYSYCIYRSKAYYLVVHIYSRSSSFVSSRDMTAMQVNSMKIGKLLTKR